MVAQLATLAFILLRASSATLAAAHQERTAALIAVGEASWYNLPGDRMADGEWFSAASHSCAMRYEPFGTVVTVVDRDNGHISWCIIRDRGPYVADRVIDVTPRVRDDLHMGGLADVKIYKVRG